MATLDQSPQQRRVEDSEGLNRDVGFLGLLWASEGSIIGSGWLFGAFVAVTLAGPAVLISWGIAAVIIILLALVHAELGGLFPVTGGTSRFPHYAFGSIAGGTFGWFAYLQAATVAPIEVLAVIQYLSTVSWAKSWYKPAAVGPGTLSGAGIVAAVILMVAFVVVNMLGVKWLARSNNVITTWKVLIPILAIIVLLATHLHTGNFTAGGGFFVKGSEVKSILIAIPAGGIVFSLLGFEQAVQLGGEARNPERDLPRAVILSILIGAAIYILVQVAFIGALQPATIAHYGTWSKLSGDAGLSASPFYTLAKVVGLGWLAWILRLDAIVSPGGTGLIYLTSASRISFGLSKNGYVPKVFESTSQRTKIPVVGILVSTVIGLLFLLPFPSWAALISIVTSASVMMYAGAPLAYGALRLEKPNLPRVFRMPGGLVSGAIIFALANFIVYWAGWGTYTTLMLALLIGYVLMFISYRFRLNSITPNLDWGAAIWIFPYLIGMGIISYFGAFGNGPNPSGIFNGLGVFKSVIVGGHGDLPLYWDLLVLFVFSVGIYALAMKKRLPAAEVDHYVRDVYPPPLEVE